VAAKPQRARRAIEGGKEAGSTYFVVPELVIGTLREGFERIGSLPHPLAQARPFCSITSLDTLNFNIFYHLRRDLRVGSRLPRTPVSGCENPRNSGCRETRFAEQKSGRGEIMVSSEKSSPSLWHSKSRECLARKRNNITSTAKTVPRI
jgi:hypothetical protein